MVLLLLSVRKTKSLNIYDYITDISISEMMSSEGKIDDKQNNDLENFSIPLKISNHTKLLTNFNLPKYLMLDKEKIIRMDVI